MITLDQSTSFFLSLKAMVNIHVGGHLWFDWYFMEDLGDKNYTYDFFLRFNVTSLVIQYFKNEGWSEGNVSGSSSCAKKAKCRLNLKFTESCKLGWSVFKTKGMRGKGKDGREGAHKLM